MLWDLIQHYDQLRAKITEIDLRDDVAPVRALPVLPAKLEAALRETSQFGPGSRLNCEPVAQGRDYVCSYLPTPLEPKNTTAVWPQRRRDALGERFTRRPHGH